MEARSRRASSRATGFGISVPSSPLVLAIFCTLLFVFLMNAYKAPLMFNFLREGRPYEISPWKFAKDRIPSRIGTIYLLIHLINAMATVIVSGVIVVTSDPRRLETLRWWRFVLHIGFAIFLLPNIHILGSTPIWVALVLNGGPYLLMEFSRRFPTRSGDWGYLLSLLLAPALELFLVSYYYLS